MFNQKKYEELINKLSSGLNSNKQIDNIILDLNIMYHQKVICLHGFGGYYVN
jgi:hypothetical protein